MLSEFSGSSGFLALVLRILESARDRPMKPATSGRSHYCRRLWLAAGRPGKKWKRSFVQSRLAQTNQTARK